MKKMDNVVVEEFTNEEVEVVELVEDMNRSFAITVANQVILRDNARTPQQNVITVNPLTM